MWECDPSLDPCESFKFLQREKSSEHQKGELRRRYSAVLLRTREGQPPTYKQTFIKAGRWSCIIGRPKPTLVSKDAVHANRCGSPKLSYAIEPFLLAIAGW
jgi:hypothetical protein